MGNKIYEIKRKATFLLSSKINVVTNSINKHDFVISFIGSSVTQGAGASHYKKTWISQLVSSLERETKLSIRHFNNGFGGYNVNNLRNENKFNLVIKQSPNLIVVETCDINNYGDHLSMDTLKEDLKYFVDEINHQLPNSRVIFLPSNPTPRKLKQEENKEGLLFLDYKEQTKDFCIKQNWVYIDFWDDFFNHLKAEGLDFNRCFDDQVHPNDIGYKVWYESLKNYILIPQ